MINLIELSICLKCGSSSDIRGSNLSTNFQYACYDVIGLLDDRRGNLQCMDNFVSLVTQKLMRNSIAIELVN